MVERSHPARTINANSEALASGATMTRGTEHLLAGEHKLDRSAGHPRRKDRENLRSVDDRLGTEATAEVGAADQDVLGRDTEVVSVHCTGCHDGLVRHVEYDMVAVPLSDDRMGFHRIVILVGRFVGLIDRHPRVGVASLDVAVHDLGRKAEGTGLELVGLVAIEPEARR